MIKVYTLFLFLIIGCQSNWSAQEQNDFTIRCMKNQPENQTLESHTAFCDCLLKHFIKSNLSYSQFLNSNSDNLETEFALKSCIKNP